MGQEMRMNTKRSFSDEFKTEAVRRVLEDGKTPSAVARELGVQRQNLASWLKRAAALTGKKQRDVLDVDDRAELKRLRRENERLKLEREILKKAAFFASESR
jgi:transposase